MLRNLERDIVPPYSTKARYDGAIDDVTPNAERHIRRVWTDQTEGSPKVSISRNAHPNEQHRMLDNTSHVPSVLRPRAIRTGHPIEGSVQAAQRYGLDS